RTRPDITRSASCSPEAAVEGGWMGVLGRHRRPMNACRAALLALTAAGFTAALLTIPAGSGASGTADRLTGATRRESVPSGGHGDTNRPFGGVAAVGALFTEVSGRLGRHFCTASVVDSPGGDVAVSAAHCFSQSSASGPVVFVPGYDKGAAPY